MKKIVALVLTLAMVMSLSMVAFADEEPGEGGEVSQQRIGETSLNVAVQEGEDEYEDYEGLKLEWAAYDGYAIVSGPYAEYEWDRDILDYVLVEEHEDTSVVELAPPAYSVTLTNLSSPSTMAYMIPIFSYTARMWALVKNGGGSALARDWSTALETWAVSCEPLYVAPGDGTPPESYTMSLNNTIELCVDEDLIMGYINYVFDKGAWDPAEDNSAAFDLGFELSDIEIG